MVVAIKSQKHGQMETRTALRGNQERHSIRISMGTIAEQSASVSTQQGLMMTAESWTKNWEVVRRIGEGGQGTVDLVRRRLPDETSSNTASQLRKTLLELTSNVYQSAPDHERTTKDLVEILRRLLDLSGEEFGALKTLKNP